MAVKKLCPCGKDKSYEKCCGLYIEGDNAAPTAEALMRSRYTAYTKANIDYIQATMQGKAAMGFDPTEARQWAKTVKWKGLKVLRTFPHETDSNRTYVEFVATYMLENKIHKLTEVSEFQLIEGKWYYIDRQ